MPWAGVGGAGGAGGALHGSATAIGLPTAALERAFADFMPRDRDGLPEGRGRPLTPSFASSSLSRLTTSNWPMAGGALRRRLGKGASGSRDSSSSNWMGRLVAVACCCGLPGWLGDDEGGGVIRKTIMRNKGARAERQGPE